MAAPKILSVDDSKMIHTLIKKGLEDYEVELFFASNGVEGLAAANRVLPDLIILDITMPVMDGVECLMKLKSDSSLRDIPVIMLTAEAGKENVLKIVKIGVRDYLVKPFTGPSLHDRVSRVIELKPRGLDTTRRRTIEDPSVILVVDEHPIILETVRKALAQMPWNVVGADQCADVPQILVKSPPDAVLISLSLPNQAALNLFRTLRSNVKFQNVPILGLSVKTALEEQVEAKNVGFSEIVTKPIEGQDLPERLARVMHLDTSPLYFHTDYDILTVKFPKDLSQSGASDLRQHIEPMTQDLVEAGMNKLMLDLSEIDRLEIYLIKVVLNLIKRCQELDIKCRLVGSAEFTQQSKGYEELAGWQVFSTKEEAIEDLKK